MIVHPSLQTPFPIPNHYNNTHISKWSQVNSTQIKKEDQRTRMRRQRNNRRPIQPLLRLKRPNQLRRLHPAHKRHRHIHQHNIKRPPLRNPQLETLHRQTAILRNLHRVPVLLQNLDSEFLVHEVVLCE